MAEGLVSRAHRKLRRRREPPGYRVRIVREHEREGIPQSRMPKREMRKEEEQDQVNMPVW